jgi:hypothetical protein
MKPKQSQNKQTLKTTLRSPAEKVLSILQSMHETQIHKDVIHPLLIALGFKDISYVHGPQERGKDFVYIEFDRYNIPRLHVCQVKNQPMTGQARHRESVTEVMNQLVQCSNYEVLNSRSNAKELPWQITLYTTYPLPDAALADAQPLLDLIRRSRIIVVGPEQLVELIQTRLPQLFADLVFPQHSQLAQLRAYLDKHHESIAFDTHTARTLSSFFTPIDVTPIQSWARELQRGRLALDIQETSAHRTPCNYAFALRLSTLLESIPKSFRSPPPFSFVGQSLERFRKMRRLAHISHPSGTITTEHQHEDRPLSISFGDLIPFLRSMDILAAKIADLASRDDLKSCQEAIKHYLTCGTLVGEMLNHESATGLLSEPVKDSSSEPGHCLAVSQSNYYMPAGCTINNVGPDLFLSLGHNLLVLGDAGAGKTTFARAMARLAIDQGKRVVFFPCHRVSDSQPSLSKSIQTFLRDICGFRDTLQCKAWLESAELIILDGCDEADTYGRGLAEEIEELFLQPIEVGIAPGTIPVIPGDLKEFVRIEDGSPMGESDSTISTLYIDRDLEIIDRHRLLKLFEATMSDDNTLTVSQRIQRKRPFVVATVRRGAPLALPCSFLQLDLRRFTPTQLNQFFDKWCVTAGVDPGPLKHFVDSHSELREVARTPILASIVAGLYESNMELPRNEVEIYTKRFDLLFSRWDSVKGIKVRSQISRSDKERFLSRLAYKLHVKHRRSFSFADADSVWRSSFRSQYPTIPIDELLHELAIVNNVIEKDGIDEYSLGHLSFQEFLAAKDVLLRQNVTKLARVFDEPWWQRVVLFFIGLSGDHTVLFREVRRERGAMYDFGSVKRIIRAIRANMDPLSSAMADYASEDEDAEDDSDLSE